MFVKLYFLSDPPGENGQSQAEADFEVLRGVHERFPQDELFGTPEPLCLDQQHGIIATRFLEGRPASQIFEKRCGRQKPIDQTECMRRSARWLSRFHGLWNFGTTPIDAGEKLSVIEQRWSKVDAIPDAAERGLSALSNVSAQLSEVWLRKTWVHGDFTPDNILVSKQRTVGIDIGMRWQNTVLHDIAPFLNHFRLHLPIVLSRGADKRHDSMEEAFLAEYGLPDTGERQALLWMRLYFMLSYWCTHEETSRFRRLNFLGRRRFVELVEKFTRQLKLS